MPKLALPRSILLSALLSLGLAGMASAAELKLRILETSDVHMSLLNYDYYQDKATDEYGLAKTISLIKAARGESKNSLLFDNGDLLQGNPLGDYVAKVKPLAAGQVHPAYKVLNLLNVDAANIGNHEFNYGLPFLRQALAGAQFPYVNSNVMLASDPAKHAFTPYVLLNRTFTDEAGQAHPLKIGVIGFVPPQIMLWDKQNLDGKVVATDIVETARRYVPQMRAQGADLIVAIAHSGYDKTEAQPRLAENVAGQLAQVPGVDVLLLGHAHAEFPGPAFAGHPGVDLARGSIFGTPSVMPGRWGDHLGVVDLTLDNASGAWKIADSRSSLRAIYDGKARKPLVDADPLVMQTIGAEHRATLDYVRGQVAQTDAPIFSYFALVADDPSVQLVANAQLAYLKRAVQGTAFEGLPLLSAAAPFKAGGRQGSSNFTDIPAGPIAVKNVADLYVYPNTIKVLKLSGAEVREWLEMSAGQFRQITPRDQGGPAEQELLNTEFRSYNFDTLDGVSYQIDITQPARYDPDGKLVAPAAHRIEDLRYQGRPVGDGGEYLVVTNNYRASGGGNFPGLNAGKIVIDSPDENREAVVQYLSAARHFNPSADGNWKVRPVPGVKLRFFSSAAAIKYLKQVPSVRLVKDLGDGSAQYELAP
ncbi:MAG: bifunctional 2',3'-cyclic-nucleotide 2'-phosphodiesterase/3'-nucleotidase [Burkholderiaceae bacterium]